MFRTTISTLGFALLAASTGCAARGTVVAGASADATYVAEPAGYSGAEVIIEEPAPQRVVFSAPPPLVVVEPDVYVVENARYAVYFVDGFYWHVGSGGHWFRSSRWDEPWLRVEAHYVPTRIVHRDHRSYVHFHASASAHVWRQPRERGNNALRAERREERRDARPSRVEPRRDERRAPVASPQRDVRRSNENAARPDVDRRKPPRVERDDDRRDRVAPRKVERDRPRVEPQAPRREVERERIKPETRREAAPERPRVEDRSPRPDVDQARPDQKKNVRKKVDDKRKPKAPVRGRAPNPAR